MVVNNTVKYKGCAGDRIMVCSVQSFVRDKRGELSSAKYSPVKVEHGPNDIVIKAMAHAIIRDQSGKIVRRANTRNDELTH